MEVIIWEIIVKVCKYPGAIILHVFSGFKKPVDYFLNHRNSYGVGIIGLLSIIAVVYLISC